jgi:hypothetical protein
MLKLIMEIHNKFSGERQIIPRDHQSAEDMVHPVVRRA